MQKRIKWDSYLGPSSKMNSRRIRDSNVRTGSLQTFTGKQGSLLLPLGLADGFLGLTPQAKATKARVNKGDHIRPKSSAQAKGRRLQTK